MICYDLTYLQPTHPAMSANRWRADDARHLLCPLFVKIMAKPETWGLR